MAAAAAAKIERFMMLSFSLVKKDSIKSGP
jgi:hypothetical protein